MTYFKRSIYVVSLLFIVLASIVAFLFTTTPGLYTTVKFTNLFIPGNLHIHQGSGHLSEHFEFDTLIYEDNSLHIEVRKGHVDWNWKNLFHHQLTITDLNAKLLIVKLVPPAHRVPHLPIRIQVDNAYIEKIKIDRPANVQYFNQSHLKGWLDNKKWDIFSLKTQYANLNFSIQANGQFVTPYPLSGTFHFAPVLASDHGLTGELQLSGDKTLFHWQSTFKGSARVDMHGTLKNGTDLFSEATWHDAHWMVKKKSTLKSSQGHVVIQGTLANYTINANSRIEMPVTADLQFTAHIKDKRATIDSILHLSQDPLKTTITGKGFIDDAQHAKLTLTLNPGVYKLPASSPVPVLPFKGGDVLLNITPQGLFAEALLTIEQQKAFNLTLRMPQFNLNNVTDTTQPIDGKLKLQLQSLNFLEGLSKAGERLAGQLQLMLTASGTLAKPILAGELAFTNGSLSVPKSGLAFSPITAKLQSSNKRWQAQGSMGSEGHVLTLKGQGNFSPELSGQLNLHGDDFPVIKTKDYVVNLSPQLALTFKPTSYVVTGSILVPFAQLKPMSFSNTTNLSEDVVFVKKESAAAPNPFNLTTDIQIKMGQDVALDVKGLHGFLDGAIHVKQVPHGTLTGIGELSIRDGKYKAYGQDLIVNEGQLLFTGGPIDNPSIRLRAIRKFSSTNSNEGSNQLLDFSAASLDTIDITSETTVGIELSGRLNSNKIKLFSIPANMSQSDILSMLLLGKPASQASKSGGQLLLAAISSMNLDSGTKGLQLIEQLKQTIGVDFNLQTTPRYNQGANQQGDKTALVVGKSLTKRLYVSYNVGLLQTDSNVLTLKYLLNKFFSIQVTASDSGSGLDLLYTNSTD